MTINEDKSTFKSPYTVVLIDADDSSFYADVYDDDRMIPIVKIDNLNTAKAYCDAMFVLKNYMWNSFEEMYKDMSGWDVRLYDANYSCVYAAHEKFKKNWFV